MVHFICPLTWIYLAVIIPVIWLLRPAYLSFANILTAGACLQGFGPQIYPCGQHWFISYVLVCYCIMPWLPSFIQKLETGGGWIRLGLFILLAQIVTIPMALWMKFKSAYISTYVLGFYYGRRFRDGGQFSGNRLASGTVSEKKLIDALFIVAAIAGLLVRIALEIRPLKGGPLEPVSDLLTQYGHVFQGSAFFIVVTNLSVWKGQFSPLFRKRLSWLAGITYPVYLEHEFFTKDIFTDFFAVAPYLQAIISFIAIALSALLFQKILNWTRKL